MPVIRIETFIKAPIERCYDLSRSVELHTQSTIRTGERAVGGVTSGLMGLNDEITWYARHFGIWQHLTSRITRFEFPTVFRDSMVRGAFRRIDHDHLFEEHDGGTMMYDVFDYDAPLGPLGWLAERLFLTAYMRRFLLERCRVIRETAESEQWRRFLPH